MEDKQMEARRAQFAGEAGRLLATDPEWVQIAADFSGAEVPAESRLTERERLLCVLSALLGCQGLGEYRRMLVEALRGGLDPAAVKETVYQATAYLGIGRVRDFLEAANEILAQQGVPLPLPPQGTTDAATRFSAGLEKQVQLFGPGMAARQTDCPLLRRNVNRWLAANCFGDYYTRKGLDLKEREMITFCFLAAQGGCEPQLIGHAKGNMNLGNDRAFLVKVVSQCLPYIGYPRSLNAITCIQKAADGE